MFSIAPYRVTVTHSGKTIPLWNTGGTTGLSTWFYKTLAAIVGDVTEIDTLARSRLHSIYRNADTSVVCGIFQTGENGFTSELVDTDTGQVNHNRKVTEAEFLPFFFMLAVPKGSDFGVLTLQKFKNIGIRDALTTRLIEKFEASNNGKRLKINRLVPLDLAKKLLNQAAIKSIRLINYQSQDDPLAGLGQGYDEKIHSVEMVFKPSRDGHFPVTDKILKAIKGEQPISGLFAADGFEYEKVKMEMEVNGKRRVLDLGRPDVLTPNVDVTEDLEIDISGHPKFASLVEVFGDFVQDTLNEDGGNHVLDLELTEELLAEPLPQAEGVENAF